MPTKKSTAAKKKVTKRDPFAALRGGNYVPAAGTAAIANSACQLPLANIAESPFNPRSYYDANALAELAESLKQVGLIEPIVVRPIGHMDNGWEIVVGHRRARAARDAGWTNISAIVMKLDDQKAAELQIVENLQRQDVSALDEARGFRNLLDNHGMSADALAQKVGKSRGYIYQQLKLLDLCSDATEALVAQRIDPSVGVLIARLPTPELQRGALLLVAETRDEEGEVTRERLSARRAAEELRRFYPDLEAAPFKMADEKLLPNAGACSGCPKRTGNDRETFRHIRSPNVCTDLGCYDAKVTAVWELAKAEATRKGWTILEDAEAVVVARHSWSEGELRAVAMPGWVLLNEPCEVDPDGRSYRKLIKKGAPVSIGRTPRRVPFQAMKQTAAFEWLAATYPEIKRALKKAEKEEEAAQLQRVEANTEWDKERERRAALSEQIRALDFTRLNDSALVERLRYTLEAGIDTSDLHEEDLERLELSMEANEEEIVAAIRKLPLQLLEDLAFVIAARRCTWQPDSAAIALQLALPMLESIHGNPTDTPQAPGFDAPAPDATTNEEIPF